MIKDLNVLIRRKKFNNFIRNGEGYMNYRISDDISKKAKQIIENDEINERLIILKNQLNFLGIDENVSGISNTDDVMFAKDNINKLQEVKEILNFKKVGLESLLNDKLSNFDIAGSVKVKEDLADVVKTLEENHQKEKELLMIVANDKIDYDNQMIKLKQKYDDVDILKHEIDETNFSASVINDYKRFRASALVSNFLDSLSDEKRMQVLNDNENLKGYMNVGEDI